MKIRCFLVLKIINWARSIPLTISISNIKKGSKALLVGFGAGLSWGAISFNEFEVRL